MTKSRRSGPEAAALRRRAEEQVAGRKPVQGDHDPDTRRLVHELEVHQVELETQNEELRRARLEVESGLKRYTEIFDFAPIGYFVLSKDGSVVEVNLAGARLLATPRNQLVGKRLAAFVSERYWSVIELFLRQVLGDPDQGSHTCELTLVGSGAGAVEVCLTAASLGSIPPAVLVAAEDVTGRRRAEEALREEIRHKDEFLAVLSHELRNPLAPIRTSLYVLERVPPGGEEARRAQAIIDRQVTHLTRIVEDLLDVTRIVRGKIRLKRDRLELGELVRRTLDDHRPGFEAAGISLQLRLGSELVWVDADGTRLVQVLGNLLGNAAKFTPGGGRVEVSLRMEGRAAVLSVRDTGVGIPPEVRERLFQPFSQAPQSLARAAGGLGLGLAMVKGLVELHGGTVELASDGPGCGSEFTVRLPATSGPEKGAPAAEPVPIQPCRILVIEDNVDAADSLRDALELAGHDVRVAHEGLSGIAQARECLPEVVICDVGLPGMDGYETARAFRKDPRLAHAFLIALSGYALPEDLQHAFEAGFDRHVAKPPSLDGLVRVIAEAPAASSSRGEVISRRGVGAPGPKSPFITPAGTDRLRSAPGP